MVRYSRSIEQRKQFYNSKANSLGMLWRSYNERTNRLCEYINSIRHISTACIKVLL